MRFVQEPHGKRQATLRLELAARVGKGVEVVRDLLNIRVGVRVFLGFECEKVHERRLSTFDLRRYHSLFPHEGIDEPIERRHHVTRQVESAERLLGFLEAMFEFRIDDKSWPRGRQIEGNEGVDFLTPCGHAFISAYPALWHLAADLGHGRSNDRTQ
jgi:hypothetical protein